MSPRKQSRFGPFEFDTAGERDPLSLTAQMNNEAISSKVMGIWDGCQADQAL
jgi:hypothetical protein